MKCPTARADPIVQKGSHSSRVRTRFSNASILPGIFEQMAGLNTSTDSACFF